jgi:predicted nucleic acid-binding protein
VNAAFADTSFFLALLRADDPANAKARAELAIPRQLVTTEFILLELGNACARAEDHGDFLALVAGMRSSPRTTIVGLDSALLERGMRMMGARKDKDWSLTDCISFVVMQERGLMDALTTDKHFEQAGFKALLKSAAT